MKDRKFKSLIGNECATWNCDGVLVEEGKLSLKCSKCGRTYWKDELLNVTSIDKEKNE